MLDWLSGRKTFLVALLMALVPVLDAFDVISLTEKQITAIEMMLTAALGTTIRLGLRKVEDATKPKDGGYASVRVLLAASIALILPVALALVLAGCEVPTGSHRDADKAAFRRIAPHYVHYYDADDTLTDNARGVLNDRVYLWGRTAGYVPADIFDLTCITVTGAIHDGGEE